MAKVEVEGDGRSEDVEGAMRQVTQEEEQQPCAEDQQDNMPWLGDCIRPTKGEAEGISVMLSCRLCRSGA